MKLPFMVIFFACTLVGLGAAMPRSLQGDWYERGDWSGNDGSYETFRDRPVALHLYVDPSDNDHHLSTSTTRDNGTKKFRYEGVVGLIYATPQDETVPLIRYWSTRTTSRHYGTTKLPDFGDGFMGYHVSKVLGYVYPLPKARTIPLYQWYDINGEKSHIVTPIHPGYEYAGAPTVLAYIYPK